MSRRPRQVGGGRGVTDPSRPRTERSAQPRTREERSGAPQRSAVKALREEPPHRTAPLPLPEGTAQRTARGRSGSEGWRLRTAPRGQRRGTQPGTQTRLRCPTADPTRPGTAHSSRSTGADTAAHSSLSPPLPPHHPLFPLPVTHPFPSPRRCCSAVALRPPHGTPALTPRSASLCGSRSRTPPFIAGQGGASRRRPGFPPRPAPPARQLLSRGGFGDSHPPVWDPPIIGAAGTPIWKARRRLQRDGGTPPAPRDAGGRAVTFSAALL